MVFEVPLSFLMEPVNHQRHSRMWKEGIERHYYAMPFGERFITSGRSSTAGRINGATAW